MWRPVINCLDKAIKDKVAPAIVLLVWRGQREVLFHAGTAGTDTVFDLASLTKPCATTLLALDCPLAWQTTLGEIWKDKVPPDKRPITIKQLLTHSSGLADWRPYYKDLLAHPPKRRKALLESLILAEPLVYAPGAKALYSDLGYMLLGMLLEEHGGSGLDKMFDALCSRLCVSNGPFYMDAEKNVESDIAPCGSMPSLNRMHIKGEVEDENAFALGGVAAHAGLFGNARSIKNLLQKTFACENINALWPEERVRAVFTRDKSAPCSTRTAGFDTPSGKESSAGRNYPPGLIGHLGFTGVSLWFNPLQNYGVILLTNRVAYGRENIKIRTFRPELHSMLWPIVEKMHDQP